MTRPWIKLYTTSLDDVRLLRLNERQQLRYFQLYLLAGRLNVDGLFVEHDTRLNELDIAIKLRISDRKQFAADFNALKKAGLIRQNGHGPYVEAFAREQVDWKAKQEQERERKAKQRHANVPRDNGVTDKKSRNSHASVTPLDQTKTKKKIKKKKEIKNPTPQPPLRKERKAAGGGGDAGSLSSVSEKGKGKPVATGNPQVDQIAPLVMPILRSCGLSDKKILDILPKVATRIDQTNAIRKTLAALASAYSDPDAKNPPIIAAYRLEHDQVSPLFENSETWRIIPEAALTAAGVEVERLPKTEKQNPLRKVAEHVANAR